MFAPVRALTAIRPRASAGVLTATASATVVFTATPFLIPAVARELSVGLGTAGLISTMQVAGFAAASFGAGRLLTPSSRMMRSAVLGLGAANLASAAPVTFPVLLALRLIAGIALGVTTWIGWTDATRHEKGLGDIAAIGPLAATLSAPVLGIAAAGGGLRVTYLLLAGISMLAIPLPMRVVHAPPVGRGVSRSRSNRVLLIALMLLTLWGSALFVFAAAAGAQAGLSPLAVSLVYSLNAFTGIIATRITAGPRTAGAWALASACAALVTGEVEWGPAYVIAMALWGFAFWMAIPAVFRLLADRALRSHERVGDAQSMMALGRAFGPGIGGLILGEASFGALGWASGLGMTTGAGLIWAVEQKRHPAQALTPPTSAEDAYRDSTP